MTEPPSSGGAGFAGAGAESERLRLWLEKARGGGYRLRDAATGEEVRWEDPRIRVVPVAGVSFRPEEVADASFDPGERLALVHEPDNEHDPNARVLPAHLLAGGGVAQAVAAAPRAFEPEA